MLYGCGFEGRKTVVSTIPKNFLSSKREKGTHKKVNQREEEKICRGGGFTSGKLLLEQNKKFRHFLTIPTF